MNSECSKVVGEKWNVVLVAIACECIKAGKIFPFRQLYPGRCFLDSRPRFEDLRMGLERDTQTFLSFTTFVWPADTRIQVENGCQRQPGCFIQL